MMAANAVSSADRAGLPHAPFAQRDQKQHQRAGQQDQFGEEGHEGGRGHGELGWSWWPKSEVRRPKAEGRPKPEGRSPKSEMDRLPFAIGDRLSAIAPAVAWPCVPLRLSWHGGGGGLLGLVEQVLARSPPCTRVNGSG